MSVVQISRIQHRRGLSTDLPDALNEAELGFALDTGQVFIGAPSFAPIATRSTFPYQNIELLTEFSVNNLLQESIQYTYRFQEESNTNFPGEGSYRANQNYVVSRFLQEKLDDYVSVKDYGAVGDGVTDDTLAIFNAVQDVFKVSTFFATDENSVSVRVDRYKKLYFPAGTYRISFPILMYPNSNWIGDGIGKTKIVLNEKFEDQGSLDPNTDILPTDPDYLDLYTMSASGTIGGISVSSGDQLYYTGISGEPWRKFVTTNRYIVETCDVNGDTGLDITNEYFNGNTTVYDNAYLPSNIFVRGMSFLYDAGDATGGDCVRLNRAFDVFYEHCEFDSRWSWGGSSAVFGGYFDDPEDVSGNYMQHQKYDNTRDNMAVRIDSLSFVSALPKQNYTFAHCVFKNTTYAFYLTDSIDKIDVIDCVFENQYRSVVVGEGIDPSLRGNLGELTVPQTYDPENYNYGPKHINITQCMFKDIIGPAISVYSSRPAIVSAYNKFENYGRGGNDTDPIDAPAIFFYADPENGMVSKYNSSLYDLFDYKDDYVLDNPKYRLFSKSPYNSVVSAQSLSSFVEDVKIRDITRTAMSEKPVLLEGNTLVTTQQDQPTGIAIPINGKTSATNVVIDYTLVRGNSSRKGELHIKTNYLDINWWEHVIDLGQENVQIDFDVAVAVSSGGNEPRYIRVKYTDISDPNTYTEASSDIYLKWSAKYWAEELTDFGHQLPEDGEPSGLTDIVGSAGTLDYEYLDDPVIEILDYEYLDDPVDIVKDYGLL